MSIQTNSVPLTAPNTRVSPKAPEAGFDLGAGLAAGLGVAGDVATGDFAGAAGGIIGMVAGGGASSPESLLAQMESQQLRMFMLQQRANSSTTEFTARSTLLKTDHDTRAKAIQHMRAS